MSDDCYYSLPAPPSEARETPEPTWEEIALSLPLDWEHYPADAKEGWEMLLRARARYNEVERRLSEAEARAEGLLMKPVPISVVITGLQDKVRALQADAERLREALEKIVRIPAMPFPDPGAHSWQAYANAVFTAWSRANQCAARALARNGDKP